MFERLLKDPHALVRHQNGPLAEERRRYLAHCCVKEQMTWETLRGLANYLLLIAGALHLDKRSGELISAYEVVGYQRGGGASMLWAETRTTKFSGNSPPDHRPTDPSVPSA